MEIDSIPDSEVAKMSKSASGINYVWQAYGKPDDRQAAMLAMMEEGDIEAFRTVLLLGPVICEQ